MIAGQTTKLIDDCLRRLQDGDSQALDTLISRSYERLAMLTRAQLRRFPSVACFATTQDMLHDAYLRLIEQLQKTPPKSAREFLRWASQQIRNQLIDSLRYYVGRNTVNNERNGDRCTKKRIDLFNSLDLATDCGVQPSCAKYDPALLARWTEFHRKVDELPQELREVCDLLFYQGYGQQQAAEIVGVSVRTIRERWRRARRQLASALPEDPSFDVA